MTRSIALPAHMKSVAEEELVLLRCLHSLLPAHKHRPSLTLLTRNELVTVARELLDDESWPTFLGIASRGSEGREADVFVSFPMPCYRDLTTASEAETVAEMCLREGSGSLWSSAREVLRCLSFEEDPRDIANGQVFRMGLCCKGGILGVAKHSWRHVAAARLLNAAVLATCRDHQWTSLSVNLNNKAALHVDKTMPRAIVCSLVSLTIAMESCLWRIAWAGAWFRREQFACVVVPMTPALLQ